MVGIKSCSLPVQILVEHPFVECFLWFNIFNRWAAGFHRLSKLFELNFVVRKPILYMSMIKLGRQNHPLSHSIFLVETPVALNDKAELETVEKIHLLMDKATSLYM